MKVTEAAGIRMQIHQQSQSPFPDTFGYSAPTGFISSFGVRLKEVRRLGPPFGDCTENGLTDKYIYDKEYSTEGCYRSCFQHVMVARCGCADPRFPKPAGTEFCKAQGEGRACLDLTIAEVGGFHGITACDCPQPCLQEVYGVSFSAAVWPADYFELDCETGEDCVEDFKKNALLVEIFYEQLNFELMQESPAYGIASLLADFGGQLGLWMGISVITCVEIVIFFFELICAMLGCIEVDEVMSRRQQGMQRGPSRKESSNNTSATRPLISELKNGPGGFAPEDVEGVLKDKVMTPDDLYCNCH